jgi:GNAT superfamily N-acetyltransferase
LRTDGIFVRPYEPADQRGVRWLYERTPPAGRVYVRPQPLPSDLENIAGYYDAFWVAVEPTFEGDAIVGTTGLDTVGQSSGAPEPAFVDRMRRTGRLHHVLVAPERQRRGIGRLLMESAMEWARVNDYDALVLETSTEQEAAIAFYLALGFNEIGRSTIGRWELVWFELAF